MYHKCATCCAIMCITDDIQFSVCRGEKMNRSAYVSVRINRELKKETENILQTLGVKPSDAITMFYNQINLRKGLPFPVEIPNEVTKQAIKDAVNRVEMQTVNSIDDLMKAMDD